MSVTVDQLPLETDELGLQTVGQVLSHLQKENRLVVHLLIDGQQPDLGEIQRIRKSLVTGKTLYIETTSPCEMVLEVLDDVQAQLTESERYKIEAAELLQHSEVGKAMERLGVFFSSWQVAQESIIKTSELLRINLETLQVDSQSVAEVLADFTAQLRQTKQLLVDRDFVSLTDQLLYETSQTNQRWTAVLDTIRRIAGA